MIDVTDLRQAERMKREFTATVSHELRTPLTSIAGAISLLNGGAVGPLPEAARNLVAIADKNAQRLRVLIDDLLDMERLLAGKLPFAFQELELGPLLEQALSEHQPFADTHGVRLTLADHADQARVHTDPGRFQQVLSNLLSNAVKFSPQGGEVVVNARPADQTVSVFKSATRDPASTPSSARRCSRSSPRPTPLTRGAGAVPAWAWPSPANWWHRCTGVSASSPSPATAPPSGSNCRSAIIRNSQDRRGHAPAAIDRRPRARPNRLLRSRGLRQRHFAIRSQSTEGGMLECWSTPETASNMTPILYVLHSGNLYGTERMALATMTGLRQQDHGLLLAPQAQSMPKHWPSAFPAGFSGLPVSSCVAWRPHSGSTGN
jgi:hypothetical protein